MIKRRSKPRRVSVARDPKYLAFLRSEGTCPVCMRSNPPWRIEATHDRVNGMSSKGSDLLCVPLCLKHHREQHSVGPRVFWAEYKLNRPKIVEYWNQRYKEMNNDESSK